MVAPGSFLEGALQLRRRDSAGPALRVRQTLHVTGGGADAADYSTIVPPDTKSIVDGEATPSGLTMSKPTVTSDVATQSSPVASPPASGSHLSTPVSRFIVAAGTIGAFTLICVVLYVLWRIRTRRVSGPSQGRRGTDASMQSQSDCEAYDYDAELKKVELHDPEARFLSWAFDQNVSIPPAAHVRRSSDVRSDRRLARQSLQSQMTFYHAHTPSNSSQDELDATPEPAHTSLSHPKEPSRLNRGHRKDSPSPLNLSQPQSQAESDSASSRPISPRTTRTSRMSVATSVETTPRFQTVDSWVHHQAARIDRKQTREDAAPKRGEHHRYRRRDSGGPPPETPSAFRYHPGRVVSWGGASLVPSEVLDAKIGWN
ncbi:hypothetical protein GP486_006554 [Trichoglossum hirsutum]|uniref:Uncharacterized protein n=1 Tax=Trichoglossum hirsutum TaxID=265104 RepID=A0A9P8IDC4_9PEZI|nr:hypothetical protein GP486_006554 [Trichoglossum hirsutum]